MDGNIRLRRDLAAWPARRPEKTGLCRRADQSIGLAFLRPPSSPVGADPDKLLVHVFLDSRRVEFLDNAQNEVKENPATEWHAPAVSGGIAHKRPECHKSRFITWGRDDSSEERMTETPPKAVPWAVWSLFLAIALV